MPSVRRLVVCALALLGLLTVLSPTAAVARDRGGVHHSARTSKSHHASHTLSQSAPSSVRHHRRGGHRRSRTLPYTGLNLWTYAAAGLGMLAAGLLLRRLVARRR